MRQYKNIFTVLRKNKIKLMLKFMWFGLNDYIDYLNFKTVGE